MGTEDSEEPLTLSEAVLDAVADHEGVSPEELNPPLYDVVDPDALETIFRGTTGQIRFEYHDYVVTVDHAGSVRLQPTGQD